jgi:hypothetical protein
MPIERGEEVNEDKSTNNAGVEPDDADEPLAGVEPVVLVEADGPSAETPESHGDWVDADPDDPAFADAGDPDPEFTEPPVGGDADVPKGGGN